MRSSIPRFASEEVEQQLSAGLAEGEIAELVDDEIVTQEGVGHPPLRRRLLGLELIDEADEVEEAPARPGTDNRRRRSRSASASCGCRFCQ